MEARRLVCDELPVFLPEEKKSMDSAEVRVILGRAVSQCVHRVCQRRKSCWGTPAGSISPAAVGADMSTRTVERWSAKRWHMPLRAVHVRAVHRAAPRYVPCTTNISWRSLSHPFSLAGTIQVLKTRCSCRLASSLPPHEDW